MKNRLSILFMAGLLAMSSIFVSPSAGEQNARYVAEQEGKQLFLTSMMEDVVALRSCLQPSYRSSIHSSNKPGRVKALPKTNFTVSPRDK